MKKNNWLLQLVLVLLGSLNTALGQTNYPTPVEGDYVIDDFKFQSNEVLPKLSLHYTTLGKPTKGKDGKVNAINNAVDGHGVPVPHFGVVLTFDDWHALAERVRGFIDGFIIEPYIRFEGGPGEQGTMFFSDPSGNSLEFKAFKNIEAELFAT